jgi:hypothetical protein
MSYSGLGQQSSSISEPPKDPISPLVPVVPMTQGLYTTPTAQTSAQRWSPRAMLSPLLPASSTQAPVSSWRRQIENMLAAAGVMIMSLPESIVTQLWGLLRGLGADVQSEVEILFRSFGNPTVTDTQVAEKMKSVSDRYRSMRPSIPGPAVVVIDPIIDSAWRLVPPNVRPAGTVQVESVTPVASALDSVPWLWAAGSFVAGLAACAVFGGKTTTKTTPNRRVRRNRRRHR